MVRTYADSNIHGRSNVPQLLTTHRVRRIRSARKNLVHITKNGAYDPLTYFHVLDMLLDILPGETFRTRDLLPMLGERQKAFAWDAVTVGRVVSDMAETLSDSLGYKAIATNRRFDGLWFDISVHEEARAAMERLLEDLEILAREEIEQEVLGKPSKRLASPLERCPSVAL